MRKIGVFTKHVYSEQEVEDTVIEECTFVLPSCCVNETDIVSFIETIEIGKHCSHCYGCPLSRE